MATKPTLTLAEWASATNFSSGVANGFATKTIGSVAQGFVPGVPMPAGHANYWMQLAWQYIDWLRQGSNTWGADAHVVETDASGDARARRFRSQVFAGIGDDATNDISLGMQAAAASTARIDWSYGGDRKWETFANTTSWELRTYTGAGAGTLANTPLYVDYATARVAVESAFRVGLDTGVGQIELRSIGTGSGSQSEIKWLTGGTDRWRQTINRTTAQWQWEQWSGASWDRVMEFDLSGGDSEKCRLYTGLITDSIEQRLGPEMAIRAERLLHRSSASTKAYRRTVIDTQITGSSPVNVQSIAIPDNSRVSGVATIVVQDTDLPGDIGRHVSQTLLFTGSRITGTATVTDQSLGSIDGTAGSVTIGVTGTGVGLDIEVDADSDTYEVTGWVEWIENTP